MRWYFQTRRTGVRGPDERFDHAARAFGAPRFQALWERRTGSGRNVTFPARQYAVNGERRSFAVLRPIADVNAQERIRELVLQAYAEYEESVTTVEQ